LQAQVQITNAQMLIIIPIVIGIAISTQINQIPTNCQHLNPSLTAVPATSTTTVVTTWMRPPPFQRMNHAITLSNMFIQLKLPFLLIYPMKQSPIEWL
jgi:hypothetical protein